MSFFDISLRQIEDADDDRFHFRIDENGDIERDDSFHSFINVSLFTDRRADKSEVPDPQKRRGWEGDEFLNLLDYLIGSKLWLLEQARLTISIRNKAVEIVQNSLQWFVQVGYCDRVEVTGRIIRPEILEITTTFFVENNPIKSFTFDVWQKTKATPQRLAPIPKNLFSTRLLDIGETEYVTYADGVTAGQPIVSFETYINISNTGTPKRSIYQETRTSDNLPRFAVEISETGQPIVSFRDSDAGALITTTAPNPIFVNINYHLLVVVNSTTNTIKIYLNGQEVHRDISQTFGPIMDGAYFADTQIGQAQDNAAESIIAKIGFVGLYNTDKSFHLSRLYNDGIAMCYGSRNSKIRSGQLFFAELSNWVNNSGNEFIDFVNGRNISNIFDLGFKHTCLRVECNGTSTNIATEFISLWNTENIGGTGSGSLQIVLPVANGILVDWGDGTINAVNSHTYSTPGTKQIKFLDPPVGFRFNNGGDKLKFVEITQIGNLEFNTSGLFWGCANMIITANDKPTVLTTMNSLFRGCTAFNTDISHWDVSNVADMSFAFNGATNFNQDLGWESTDSLTQAAFMFLNAFAFNGDVSALNVSNVSDFSAMFAGAISFNKTINAWDMGSAVLLNNMFDTALAFNSQVNNINVSNVQSFTEMFKDASSFNQEVSNFNTASATDLSGMFLRSTAFNKDISNFNVANVTDMSEMLNNCGINNANYNSWLINCAGQAPSIQSNVPMGAAGMQYTSSGAVAAARGVLVSLPYTWSITGDIPV